MNDHDKTKEQLIAKLDELRQRVAALEGVETERRGAEQALRESEDRYRLLAEAIPQPVWRFDTNGELVDCTERWSDYTGQSAEEAKGNGWMKVVHPDDLDQVLQRIQEAGATGEFYQAEHRLRRALDGSYRWQVARALPLKDKNGKITGWFGSATDIDDRKRVEEALRESEERYRVLSEAIPQSIWQSDANGNVIAFNCRWYEYTGQTPEEAQGNGWMKALHPDDVATVAQRVEASVAGGESIQVEYRLRRASDGSYRWHLARSIPMKDKDGMVIARFGSVTDVDDQKRAEEMLKKAHEELEQKVKERTAELTHANEELAIFRRFAEASSQGFSMADLDGHLAYLNPAFCRMLGDATPEDRIGQHLSCCYSDESNRRGREEIEPLLKQNGHWEGELPLLSRQGQTIPTWHHAFLIRDENGNRLRMAVVISDITERKQAEEAILRAKRQWERTFDSVPDLIAILDDRYRIVQVNQAMAKRLGLMPEQCIGLTCYESIHGLSEPSPFCPHALSLADGKEHEREVHEDRLGGDFLVSTSPLFDHQNRLTGSVHVARDITERKQAEEMLRQSHEELRTLYEGMRDGLLIADLETKRYLRANPAICRMLDYSEAELLAMTVSDIHPAEEIPAVLKRFEERAEGRPCSIAYSSLVRRDGSVLPVEIATNTLTYKGRPCVAGFFRDITERKKAEQKTAYLASFPERNPQPVIELGLDGDLRYANPAAQHLFPELREQGLAHPWLANWDTVVRPFCEGRTETTIHEVAVSDQWYQQSYHYVAQEQVVRIYGVEITERKQAEEALRASEERYRAVVEDQTEVISRFKADGTFTFTNEVFCRFFGKTSEELLGNKWHPVAVPDDVPMVEEQLRTLSVSNPIVVIENRVYSGVGHVHWMQFVNRGFFDREGRLLEFQSVGRDITERKRAEEALQREYRTVKQMLQSSDHERQLIAYEIHDGLAQQLAAAIMQFDTFDHLKETKSSLAAKAYDAAMTVLRQGHFEARRLIAGVRPPVLDESGVVEAIAHLVHEESRRKVPEIECHSKVNFDRLVPILENAIYRIVQESVTNACNHSKSQRVRISLLQQGNQVRIEIRDWGVGFDAKVVQTNRFGLSGIRERARLLGGKCRIRTKPGKGTSIVVELPVLEREEED